MLLTSGGALVSSAPTKQTVILPQIAQNSQNLLLRRASHRLHRPTQIRWVRKIVAEVSLPPQQQLCLGRINNGLNGFLLLGKFNNGLNGLNGFLLLGMFNNGLNGLNGFDGCVMLTTD